MHRIILGTAKCVHSNMEEMLVLLIKVTGNYYFRTEVSSLKMVIQRYFSVMEFDAQ